MVEIMLAPTPQLTFGLNNPDAPGTIYVSTDPADNKLTLVMSATVSSGFTVGTLVPPGQAMGGTGSLVYLNLTPLGLTSAEFEALELVADGWTCARYSDETGQYIGFTPTAPVTLQPAPASIGLSLTGFTLAQAPGASASLSVLSYRVSGVTSGNFPFASNIGVVFAVPDDNTGDLTTALDVELTPVQVVQSIDTCPTIENELVLSFTQKPNAPTINSGSDTAFVLNFVYATDANGYGALLTTDEGKKLGVNAGAGATGWTIVPNLNTPTPSWTLEPPPDTAIFGGGAESTLAFDISQLVTSFKPGPTVVMISYSNVPGYKNGSFAITVLKQPHVSISTLTVDPVQSVLEDGSATVTLNWTTSYATRLTLQPIGADVTGQTSYQATIEDSIEFTLIAEGPRPNNVDNVDSQSVVAQVLPVINSFTASPSSIYVGDFGTGYSTNLAWNVNTNDNVTLTSSTTGPTGPSYPPVSAATVQLQTPQMLTLKPQAHTNDPTVSRSLIVSGFQLLAQQAAMNHDSGYVAAPPNADFVAVTAPNDGLVSILSTATFLPITTITVGDNPNGIAFSRDGSLMYVANAGNGTISIFQVATSQSAVPFSFTSLATVEVGGAPRAVVVGPDGTAFVAVDYGDEINGQVAFITDDNGTFKTGTPVTVGTGPSALALSPNGASLYVANAGSDSISLVTLGGSAPAVGTLLTNIGGPLGLTVTPDGKKLLVAAASDNMVYGFNTRYPTTSPRQTYPLGGASFVAALPSGDYAVATGYNPNSVILINYAKGSISATQALESMPLSVAIPPEGGLAVVALPGSKAVEVVTFAQYGQVATTPGVGGQITNLAVSPDNQTLIGWFDAAVTVFGAGGPMKGMVMAPVSGSGVSPYLAGAAINFVAISPAAANDAFYVAPAGKAEVDVYTLSSVASIATIPIAKNGAPSRQAVGLAVSSDGGTLFVLTNDGNNQFSFVIVAANVAQKSFSVVADKLAYTAQRGQVAYPFAIGPTSAGTAAYAVDTTTATLWSIAGSGNSWSVGSQSVALAPGVLPLPTPGAIAVSPDGSTAYVTMQAGTTVYVSTIDLGKQAAVPTRLPDNSSVMNLTSLAVSADGRSLYASDAAAAAIRIVDAASLRIDQTISWQSGVQAPWGIAAASDGTGIFTANLNSANIAIAQQMNPT